MADKIHAGKVAVITGSTSGIGFGIAKAFAEAGMNIVLNGLCDKAVSDDAIKTIKDLGVDAIYHPADMTKPEQIADMVAVAHRTFGRLDVLVNNAGIQNVQPVEEFSIQKWDAIIAINLSSAFHTIRAAVPIMKQAKSGRIINMSSVHGLVASPFKSAYVAAKHGLIGFTKSIALELAEFGITANSICPGYVWTPLVEGQVADTAKARNMTEEQVIKEVLLKAQPTKQFVTIENVAAMALFLCSADANNITGSSLSIDGGWSAQ